MRRLFLFIILSFFFFGCAAVELNEKNVNSCVLAEGYSYYTNIKNIRDSFTLNEEIYIYVGLTWDENYGNGGYHEVSIVWYKDNKMLCENTSSYQFEKTPAYIWADRPAKIFGIGKHYVEVYIDDKKVATKRFEILDKKA